MATYRAHVIKHEAAANGDVHLDCWIQRQDGEEWVAVEKGHRTMSLDNAAILLIANNGAMTDGQKVAALAALFRATAVDWGIATADDANEALSGLVSFPVDVAL